MPPTAKRGDASLGVTKKKDGHFTRTGQACDRCKVRKIRCDARPGGCSPCLQNNSECKTTDRITGRATARGHTETLESENASLKMYMADLQQQLRQLGVEPKKAPPASQAHLLPPSYSQQRSSWADLNGDDSLMSNHTRTERQGSTGSLLPEFRTGCIGDNYLGVSSGNNWLSPIEGTSLALFGMKIDVAEFLPPESDPTAAPMSYRTFLAHALGKSKPVRPPPLPNYDECKFYADWYFKTLQVFIPVLHRPDFMKLLSNIFHGPYSPNPAETVMVHMVVAICRFQVSRRNAADQSPNEYMQHYHYALSLIPDLITGHTLQDIQALVLICAQLRNQPRPGAAWMFINAVFGIVVEIGLHRSSTNWQGSASEHDPQTVEMRKRIFWTMLLLHVNLGGKLGRPMPIRLEDFDIEIPEAEPDHMPHETDLSDWQKCSFRAAIHGFKLLKILMQVFHTVYSIRSGAEPYDTTVRNIESQLDEFHKELPPELSSGPDTTEEDRCPALYLDLSVQILRLVLHHPSLCRSTSPELLAHNVDVCLEVSSKLLASAIQVKNLRALDTNWMQTTDFLAGIFTTLFVYTQRQDHISSAELQRLKEDMDAWLDVMSEAGIVLGAGSRLREAVKPIIDYSLSNISRHLAAKTASAGLDSTSIPSSPAPQSSTQQRFPSSNGHANAFSNGTSTVTLPHASQPSFVANHQGAEHTQSYPAGEQMYTEPQAQSMSHFNPGGMNSFHPSNFDTQDMKPHVGPQMPPNHSVMANQASPQTHHENAVVMPHHGAPAFFSAYQSSPYQNGFHADTQSLDMLNSGPAAWRMFADSMMPNLGVPEAAQEYIGSANPLMAMGGDKQLPVDMAGNAVNGMGGLSIPNGQPPWPLNHYSSGPPNG